MWVEERWKLIKKKKLQLENLDEMTWKMQV